MKTMFSKWKIIPKTNKSFGVSTYKTKLKLDEEVGGGDLSELCTITYLIAYPYAWTVNFEICIDMQLTAHQPPIPKASQAVAWSHKYIGYWNGKTEGSPIGFVTIFWGLKSWKNPWAKAVHFEPLGALFGAGAPDPDLARLGFSIEVMHAKCLALDTRTQMNESSRNPYNYWLKWTEVHQTLIITGSNEPKFTKPL